LALIEQVKAKVQMYSTVGYHDGTRRVPAQGSLPTLQKQNGRDHEKKSIESVIQEVREERARSEGQSVDRIKPYKESFVYQLCNSCTPEKVSVPTKRNQALVEALSDMYAAISMAAILGGCHDPFGMSPQISRFIERYFSGC
jgi:hypothetical protein